MDLLYWYRIMAKTQQHGQFKYVEKESVFIYVYTHTTTHTHTHTEMVMSAQEMYNCDCSQDSYLRNGNRGWGLGKIIFAYFHFVMFESLEMFMNYLLDSNFSSQKQRQSTVKWIVLGYLELMKWSEINRWENSSSI